MDLTFEQQAELEIQDITQLSPADPDEDKAMWHAGLFLMDYEIALNSPVTTPEHFLTAYGNRALAIKYCRPEERAGCEDALDSEGYRLRQQWQERNMG